VGDRRGAIEWSPGCKGNSAVPRNPLTAEQRAELAGQLLTDEAAE
jgi:hypothetical protein